ncbi:MAG: hypothetical protein ACKOXF_02455 [Chitinophagaceae bacterium]
MLKPFLFLFLLFSFSHLQSQGIDTDSTKHYLILRSKSPAYHSRIFGEGKRLTLFHKNGNKFKGRMYFISDSVVKLINVVSLKSDTFALNDISKIKNSTLLSGIMSYTAIISSGFMLGGGIYLLADGGEIENIVGAFLTIGGVVYLAGGLSAKDGKPLHLYDYDLKQHTAKGYKLKHKHLKFLYPRK